MNEGMQTQAESGQTETGQTQTELTTTITGVTIYPDRAQVTRAGEARLAAPGEHVLRIGGLPLGIERESLRATGRGPTGTRILGVEQATEMHPAAPEETLRRMREEIERLEREVSLLDDRVATLDEQHSWLKQLGEQTARSLAWGMARGTSKPSDVGTFFAYASDEAQRLSAAKLDMQRQRAQLQRDLDARRREYAMVGGGRRPDRLAALVRIELATPGAVRIELSYLIGGAEWHPRYDARVDVAARQVHLAQQALVSQRTGEDWSQVALALSTARPSAAVRLPDDPDPWYLELYKPAPLPPPMPVPAPRTMAMRAKGGAQNAADGVMFQSMPMLAASAAPMEEVDVEHAAAEVERSGTAQLFRLPGQIDVPSDGAPHILGIGAHDLPARLDYVAEPVVAAGAHLRAMATNGSGRVLLPGELHVFQVGTAGDEYVGRTHLELTPENAELPLYLGVDDNMAVKRELIQRDTDKGNLLQRGIRKATLGYRVTLTNHTGAAQRVVLKDRLPVPRNERIKLTNVEIHPQPTSRTGLEQLTWDLQLAPDEERRIEWRFVVESPTDAEVVGLP
jgi:uncharacterized protein (TIGR02231 family)